VSKDLAVVLLPPDRDALAVVVAAVAAASGMRNPERTVAAAAPDAAFVGTRICLLLPKPSRPTTIGGPGCIRA